MLKKLIFLFLSIFLIPLSADEIENVDEFTRNEQLILTIRDENLEEAKRIVQNVNEYPTDDVLNLLSKELDAIEIYRTKRFDIYQNKSFKDRICRKQEIKKDKGWSDSEDDYEILNLNTRYGLGIRKTALEYAIENEDLASIRYLLDLNKRFEKENNSHIPLNPKSKNDSLCFAIKNLYENNSGSTQLWLKTKKYPLLDSSEILLAGYLRSNDVFDSLKEHSLIRWYMDDEYGIVKLLIKEGFGNYTIENETSPLHVAANYLNLYLVNLLLENGFNPKTKDKCGCSALHKVLEPKIEYYFDINQAKFDENMSKITKLFIEKGVDINAVSNYGDNAIMSRYLHKISKNILEHLFKLGINLDTKNKYADTFLHFLFGGIVPGLLKFLDKNGYELKKRMNKKNKDSLTPLDLFFNHVLYYKDLGRVAPLEIEWLHAKGLLSPFQDKPSRERQKIINKFECESHSSKVCKEFHKVLTNLHKERQKINDLDCVNGFIRKNLEVDIPKGVILIICAFAENVHHQLPPLDLLSPG